MLEGYIKRVIKVNISPLSSSKDAATLLATSISKVNPETIVSETFLVEDTKAVIPIVAKEKVVYDGKGHIFAWDGRTLIGS